MQKNMAALCVNILWLVGILWTSVAEGSESYSLGISNFWRFQLLRIWGANSKYSGMKNIFRDFLY